MVRPEGATVHQMNSASIVAQNEAGQFRGPTIGPYFRDASRFNLTPFQGASVQDVRFPGLKPWAKSFSPSGAGSLGRMMCGNHGINSTDILDDSL
jgi:hypothetical protein